MANATNTTLGEIKLSGDLGGSNNALAPELTATGVTPGVYSVPKLTIDSKGRVTEAQTSPTSDIVALIPDATSSVKGLVKIGTNISYTNTATPGSQTVNFGATLVSGAATGLCPNGAVYTFDVLVDNQYTLNVSVPGSSASTIANLITQINADISARATAALTGGNIVITSNTSGSTSKVAISNDLLFQYVTGYVSISTAVNGMGDTTIYIPDATNTVKGVVSVTQGSGLTISNGALSFSGATLGDATTSSKGVVQVGTGLSVTGGVVSLTTPIADATTGTKGIIQVGSGLSATNGVLQTNLSDASNSVKGLCQVGAGLVATSGAISLDSSTFATSSTAGVVKIGSGLNVNTGVISVSLPTASDTVLGLIKVGSGLSIDGSGVLSASVSAIADATTTSKGVVQIGSNIDVTSGTISVATATTGVKGVVQIGTGLSVTGGVVSANLPDATTSTKGIVQVGSGLSVASGILSASIPDATTSTKGIVQVGSGLSVTGGVISANLPDATTSSKGIVQIGSGLSVASGTVSAVLASGSSTYGIVKSADTGNIAITAGAIDVGTNIPKLNTANTFTKAQTVAVSNPTFGATVTLDLSLSNMFAFTATSNFTLANPTNVVAGGIYHILVKQDATGGRNITWGSNFKFNGVPPTLSTTPYLTTIISFVAVSSTSLLCQVIGGY